MQARPMHTAQALSSSPNGTTSLATTPVLSKPLTSWLLDETIDAKAIDGIKQKIAEITQMIQQKAAQSRQMQPMQGMAQ